jgi:glucokinase
MLLGIEIGGTKLQLGVGRPDGTPLTELARFAIDPKRGAAGILEQIGSVAGGMIARHPVSAIGCGFGGPVDVDAGRVVKSHHVVGWTDFPLGTWLQKRLGLPAMVANDADTAGLAEALFGAGRGANPVFYITIGTGIGGGLIVDGQIYRGNGAGAGEIGHLRPGLLSDHPEAILESFAAGWGIAAAAQERLLHPTPHQINVIAAGNRAQRPDELRQRMIEIEEADEECVADLLTRCDGQPDHLTAKMVGEAAADGNQLALDILRRACQALGWGIAQMITLLAPERVVIGGGVSLLGEDLLFRPLRAEVDRYVFPPLAGTYEIVPAALGEEMVVHGALALAADAANGHEANGN